MGRYTKQYAPFGIERRFSPLPNCYQSAPGTEMTRVAVIQDENKSWKFDWQNLGNNYLSDTVGMHAEDNYDAQTLPNPTDAEVAFCEKILNKPKSLFVRCQTVLESSWNE